MKVFTKFRVITGGFLLAAMLSAPASASMLNYRFDISVGTGSKAGNKYSGTFGVNTSLLTGIGMETVSASYFTFDYPSYDEDLTNIPTVFFDDGIFQKLRVEQQGYWGINQGFLGGQIPGLCGSQPGCSPASYFGYLQEGPATTDGAGPITYSQVPIPATIPLMGLGLLGIAWCRNRGRGKDSES